VELVPVGLINRTYLIADGAGMPRAVAQRLHPIFAPEVNLDIDAITAHLAGKGFETPRLLGTIDGQHWLIVEGAVWRMLSFVAGTTFERIGDPALAEAAGALVGQFHSAVADLEHEFAFTRAGVHDTAAHLGRMERGARISTGDGEELREATALAAEIQARAAQLPPLPATALRICHGDLKISNLLFDDGPPLRGRCLIDLDTLGRLTIAYELGDALRSWCNPRGEDVLDASCDPGIFAAALRGYGSTAAALLDDAEVDSIVPGLETVCVELAARFCADVFEDRYFGWDARRYPSRRAHNLVRARGQLALASSVKGARAELVRIARAALRPT
jgi:Ser/Thr protein kinase RdoA (MazF antagonist)